MLLHLFTLIMYAGVGWFQAVAAPSGAKLSVRNFSSCHGAQGNGGIGVPFALLSLQAGISDDSLRKTKNSLRMLASRA